MEFDRQNQLKAAIDKRSEHRDLEEQIRKKRAEQEQARAKDETELAVAANAVENAHLEMKKNAYLGRIDQEKNEQRLEEAQAKQKQLKATFDLKRRAEQAELRILEIQRDRAYKAMKSAEDNATRMVVTSPISGMVVLRMVWRPRAAGGDPGGRGSASGHADHAGRRSRGDAGAREGQSGRRAHPAGRPAGADLARRLS